MRDRDPSLDALLGLHGTTCVLTEDLRYEVRLRLWRVDPSPERPHGLAYALNLHGPDPGDPKDNRLVGFDNAHSAPGSGPAPRRTWDHKHRLRTAQPYDYDDAGTLVADFWEAVAQMMRERGITGW